MERMPCHPISISRVGGASSVGNNEVVLLAVAVEVEVVEAAAGVAAAAVVQSEAVLEEARAVMEVKVETVVVGFPTKTWLSSLRDSETPSAASCTPEHLTLTCCWTAKDLLARRTRRSQAVSGQRSLFDSLFTVLRSRLDTRSSQPCCRAIRWVTRGKASVVVMGATCRRRTLLWVSRWW
jgi:hypothetical protein